MRFMKLYYGRKKPTFFYLVIEVGGGPPGVCGGEEGMVNFFAYEHNGKMVSPPLGSKAIDIKLRRGQRVRLETPGGGGYGDSALRSERDIANDNLQGYVSSPLIVPTEDT